MRSPPVYRGGYESGVPRALKPLLALAGAGLILAGAFTGSAAWRIADALTRPAPLPVADGPERHGLAYESAAIPSRRGNGPLAGWFFPGPPGSAGAVLFVHGWRSHRRHMLAPYLSWLARTAPVLAFDLPSQGDSPPGLVTMGALETGDAEDALAWLKKRVQGPVAAFGTSMGGTVALDLAADHPEVSGVISEATYARLKDAPEHGIVEAGLAPVGLFEWAAILEVSRRSGRWLPAYDAIDRIGAIAPRPVLLLHGTADHVVAPKHAVALYGAAGFPKQLALFKGADHMSDAARSPHGLSPATYELRVRDFLAVLGVGKPLPAARAPATERP